MVPSIGLLGEKHEDLNLDSQHPHYDKKRLSMEHVPIIPGLGDRDVRMHGAPWPTAPDSY